MFDQISAQGNAQEQIKSLVKFVAVSICFWRQRSKFLDACFSTAIYPFKNYLPPGLLTCLACKSCFS